MPDSPDRHGIPAEAPRWEERPASEQRRIQDHPEQRRKRWRIFSRRTPRGEVGVPGKKFRSREET